MKKLFLFIVLYTATSLGMQPHDRGQALIDAATCGNIDEVLILLQGLDTQALNNISRIPLIRATIKGHTEIVNLLLRHGVPPEHKDPTLLHTTALHCASIIKGRYEIAENLVEHGADVNARTCDGYTPLMLAVENGFPKLTKLLLLGGALPSVMYPLEPFKGFTPLHVAAYKGYSSIVEELCSHHPSLSISIISSNPCIGFAPIHCALFSGHTDIVATLLRAGTPPNITIERGSRKGFNLLHCAAERRLEELFPLLLSYSIKPDASISDNQPITPLHIASTHGLIHAFHALKKEGIAFNGMVNGENLLHRAAKFGHLPLVEFFIQEGIGIDSTTISEGKTPLHLAAIADHPEVVEYLLLNHANPFAVVQQGDDAGMCALNLAAENAKAASLQVLLRLGAHVDLAPNHAPSLTSLNLAAFQNHHEIMLILMSAGGVIQKESWKDFLIPSKPLLFSMLASPPEDVIILIDQASDEELNEALMMSYGQGKMAIAQRLEKILSERENHAADIQRESLLYGVIRGDTTLVRHLINILKVSISNNNDKNFLNSLLRQALFYNRCELSEILIAAGADPKNRESLQSALFINEGYAQQLAARIEKISLLEELRQSPQSRLSTLPRDLIIYMLSRYLATATP